VFAYFIFGFNQTTPKATMQQESLGAKTQATELKIEDIKVGEGREVKSGDTVVIHYKGTLTDGTKFDSSYDRGEPFETQIGVGQVIKGWDLGVVGMKIGGKRKLTIPPSLGYGEQSAGSIPPNSTLIFELELIDIK
jgi:peptidylprolyl isomerase